MTNLTDLTIGEAAEKLAKKEISSVELTKAHLDEMANARKLNAFITETPERALSDAEKSDARRAKGEVLGTLDGIPIANKEISSVELTKAHLDEMANARVLNAFITETPERALEDAKKSDERRAKGESLGALDGIPIANKDLYCTKGIRTTAASKILSKFVPPYESTVSQKLIDAGTVMLGKVNTDQFAMGGSTMTSYFGTTKNPWNLDLVPGGSSGGSAAAVAAGLCMGATGSDTGGSIRQPASFCGVTGIKPTYGRCSRYGIVAFASSLDQAGPMARSVKDCALMLNTIAGYDEKDSTVANVPVPDYTKVLTGDIRGKKIGIPKEYRLDGLNKDAAGGILGVDLEHLVVDFLELVGRDLGIGVPFEGDVEGFRTDAEQLADLLAKRHGF